MGYRLEVKVYELEVEVYKHSLPLSSVPSINEEVIQEDVGTSFILELLHSHSDGPYFHIPMSSSIEVSFAPPTTPLITLSPQSLRHLFSDDVVMQMQYFPTPLVEQHEQDQVQDQGCGRGRGNGATLDGPLDQSELERCHQLPQRGKKPPSCGTH
ncbi:hypothetical protein AAG906_010139 [Vitis piasezkii]